MSSDTLLPMPAGQEAACTTCVCITPPPADCDHTTPCFPIYPETTPANRPVIDQDELALLCGVER